MAEKPERKTPRKILCSQCGALTGWEGNPWRPFCSERCKLIDLGAWADESYRVPSEDSPGTDEEER
jgi:endogenous inhibitor of DNA gyrase (YacG/DUF329 family)